MTVFTSSNDIKQKLSYALSKQPLRIEQDDPNGGVLRPWVRRLPLRYQGVLLTGIRGCDGAPKEDDSKVLSRLIRRACLNPADPRETTNHKGFFGFCPEDDFVKIRDFFHSLDQYPLHYVMHLCHACEVIGYTHPNPEIADLYGLLYYLFCHTMHLNPEMKGDMHDRLTEDRVEKGTTARNF